MNSTLLFACIWNFVIFCRNFHRMTLADRGSMHHLQVHITRTFWYYGSYADLQMFAYSFLSSTSNDGMLLDK